MLLSSADNNRDNAVQIWIVRVDCTIYACRTSFGRRGPRSVPYVRPIGLEKTTLERKRQNVPRRDGGLLPEALVGAQCNLMRTAKARVS